MSDLVTRVKSALRDSRWEDYEETWLDAIEADSGKLSDYLEAARASVDAGEGERAGNMLTLLSPQLEQMKIEDRERMLEMLCVCLPREREHRKALLKLYEEHYGDRPGYDVFLKAANIKRSPEPDKAIPQFKNMIHFVPGSFVYHRSGWGVGEITEVKPLEAMAMIEFEGRSAHRVSVSAIPEICQLLSPNDYRVLAWRNPARLQETAEKDPIGLIKIVLHSTGRPMTLARIREALSGRVIPTKDWSKWWAKNRALLKKDPEIGVSGDKTAEYFIREGEADPIAELAARLRGTDLKTRLKILREATEDFSEELQAEIHPFFGRLRDGLVHRDGGAPLLLETLLFLHQHGFNAEDLPAVSDLLEESGHPSELINGLSRFDDQKEIIDLLREQGGEGWEKLHIELILGSDDPPRDYLLSLLPEEQRVLEVDGLAREVNSLPKRAPLFFLWLAQLASRNEFDLIPSLRGLSTADFFLRAVLLLDDVANRANHEESAELELMLKRFRQRLSNRPYTLMQRSIDGAESRMLREIYHQIEKCRGLSDTIRKRMLAALLRKEPELLSTSKKETAALDESVVYATPEAIQRKRKELEYLRNEKLPEIYKMIGDAAAMGDLSENYEFTSAIEERENMNRRVMEIQKQLDGVVQIDVSQASTSHVSLGSRATLTNMQTGEREIYSVLGPWDGDPEQGVVSYLSPLGLSLIDKASGEEFEVELPTGMARYRVESIGVHVTQEAPSSEAG